jgi:hypothetical protein
MPSLTTQAQQLDKINRADRLLATIALLEQQIQTIEANGEVAPSRCHLARYQAQGKYKAYWYYKLQADTPIFPSKHNSNKLSRYKHLGVAGSQSYLDKVIIVLRRTQIDDLQKAIDALRDSWSDLYSDSDSQDSHKKTK